MVAMKKSQFKALVKECVRECLREIMQEQLNPTPVLEALSGQPAVMPQASQLPVLINPMDDHGMRMRQELVAQRTMLQGQMQRQSMVQQRAQAFADPMRAPIIGMSELAGLAAPDPNDQSMGRRYLAAGNDGTGYMSPDDRRRQVDPYYNAHGRYNPNLDAPMGGSQPTRAPQPRAMALDPDLDTPMGGGPMRAPDPNVLRNIFEDTARTTLQHQAAYGDIGPSRPENDGRAMAGPADEFAAIAAQHDPMELFGGAAQNWGALAFGGK